MSSATDRHESSTVPRVLDVFIAEMMAENERAGDAEGMRSVASLLCDVNLGLLSPSEEAWKSLLTDTYWRYKVLGDAMIALCREDRAQESLALSQRFKSSGFCSQFIRRMRAKEAPTREVRAYLKSIDELCQAIKPLMKPITPHPQSLIDWVLRAGQEVAQCGEILRESDPILHAKLGGAVRPQDLLDAFPQADPLAIIDLNVTRECTVIHVLERAGGTVSATPILAADFTLEHARNLIIAWGRGNVVHEITARQGQALKEITNTLHDRLMCNLAKMASQRGIVQLVLIPDVYTSYLPLHLSRVCPSEIKIEIPGYDLSESVLLGEFFPVTYVPCIHAILVSQYQKRPREVLRAASFYDPLSDIPGAMSAATWLASGLPESVTHLSFIGDKATLRSLRSVLPEVQVVVINTHGSADLNRPERSHLVFRDGNWTMDDILDCSFESSPVFVLSACEAGGMNADTGIVRGGFPGGIPGALISSGAACVLASMWPVEAISMGYVTERFLMHLSHPGFSPAAALFRAQYDLRHLSKKEVVERCQSMLNQMAQDGSADRFPEQFVQLDHLKDLVIKADSEHPFAGAQYWGGIVIVGCGWFTPAGGQVADPQSVWRIVQSAVDLKTSGDLVALGKFARAEEILEGLLQNAEGPMKLQIALALADAVWRGRGHVDAMAKGRRVLELLNQAESLARSEQDERSLRLVVEAKQEIVRQLEG